MRRTRRFLAVAESMARSIALLELNYLQNAGPSAVVDPVKRKSLSDIVCQRVLSFTQSARFGEEEKTTSPRSWQIVIGGHCDSRLKMDLNDCFSGDQLRRIWLSDSRSSADRCKDRPKFP